MLRLNNLARAHLARYRSGHFVCWLDEIAISLEGYAFYNQQLVTPD